MRGSVIEFGVESSEVSGTTVKCIRGSSVVKAIYYLLFAIS